MAHGELRAGSVVRHTESRLAMTVVAAGDDWVNCMWFEGEVLHHNTFRAEAVTLLDPVQIEIDRYDAAERSSNKGKPL